MNLWHEDRTHRLSRCIVSPIQTKSVEVSVINIIRWLATRYIKSNMNPEMDRPDNQHFEVKELTEDGGSSSNLQRADHGLQGQTDHPFDSIHSGAPLQGRHLPCFRNQHGINNNDDGKAHATMLSDALRAAYEEAKRALTQDETALAPSAATSTELSEQCDPGEQHSDETQLSFPHLVRISRLLPSMM